jgi:hypothetical protein
VIYVPQVTVLKKLDTQSVQSWWFQKEVFDPIWRTIEKRALQDQIERISYSAGFPTRLVFQAELKKHMLATGQKNKIWKVAWGSTTDLTYFRDKALDDRTYMFSPDANTLRNHRVLTKSCSGSTATIAPRSLGLGTITLAATGLADEKGTVES